MVISKLAVTTKAIDNLLGQATAIWDTAPTPEEIAYMARQLVQATLPHSDPGDIPY